MAAFADPGEPDMGLASQKGDAIPFSPLTGPAKNVRSLNFPPAPPAALHPFVSKAFPAADHGILAPPRVFSYLRCVPSGLSGCAVHDLGGGFLPHPASRAPGWVVLSHFRFKLRHPGFFLSPGGNFLHPSRFFLNPGRNFLHPYRFFLNPGRNFLSPSGFFLMPGRNFLHPFRFPCPSVPTRPATFGAG
jgi:hypothetical protein